MTVISTAGALVNIWKLKNNNRYNHAHFLCKEVAGDKRKKTEWNNIKLDKKAFNDRCTYIVWVCTVSTSCNLLREHERSGGGGLSPRVPKVCRKGPFTPAIFRAICSVILGPCKLAAERVSVHFMRLMETAAWIKIMKKRNWITIKMNLKSQLRLIASNVAGFSKRSHNLIEAEEQGVGLFIASHAGVFRGARFSSPPTNACSTENNIPFPLLYLRGTWPIKSCAIKSRQVKHD